MPSANVNWPPILVRQKPWYPGQPGVPGTDNTRGQRLGTNGVVFYVDPNAAGVSDLRDGTDPEGPLATVGKALTLCRDYSNDTIIVAPSGYWRHADPTSSRIIPVREEVTISTPGVRLVGLMPSGSLGVPWGVTQDSGVAITVNAMSVLIEGFNFWDIVYNNATAIGAYWTAPAYGDNVTIRNNFFGDGLDYGVRLNFSYNTYIYDNTFQEIAVAAINSIDTLGDPDYTFIYGNRFNDNVAAIDLEDSSRCMIYDNMIMGDGTGTNNFIDLTGGSNNFVANNYLACTLGAEYNLTCSDATSGAWVNNHCENGDATLPPT